MKKLTLTLFLIAFTFSVFAQDCTPWSGNGPWNGNGRIAISSDGNEHDHDDWAATPLSLALLAAKGLQDQLVLYTYSDHVWGSNQEHKNATKQMNTSALEGKQEFGFNNTNFIEAVKNKEAAYNAMADAINASSASNPLFILGAGPMHVIGEGMKRANANKLKFVTAISHSTWNENHTHNNSWTWKKMKNNFNTVTFIDILDQNGGDGYDGLRAVISKFNWIKNSSARNNPLYKAGSWDWLYWRQEQCIKKNGTEFDPSDAGMVVYLLTGKQKTNPSDAKNIMESPVAPCDNPIVDCAGVEGGSAFIDDCGECVGGTTGKDPCILSDCQDVSINAINFNNINVNGFRPAYIDNNRGALAINAKNYKDEYAAARTPFTGATSTYDITITSMLETDGECTYVLRVGGALIGSFTNIPTNTDYTLYTHTFEGVAVSNGAAIQVEFNSASNGKIPEGDGFAYARGRWTKIDFVCAEPTTDCAGVEGGTAYIDDCGECVGGTTGKEPCVVVLPKDCAKVPGGTAYIDDCGDCVGGTTGLEPCTLPCTGNGYVDRNGLIIMEAENTKSALGKWQKKTANSGYTGSGHIEFTGNKPSSGPATSPLTYKFTVNTAGEYRLVFRAHKRLAGAAPDHCNDSYIKMSGDFTAGQGGAPLNLLTKNVKFFGGAANGWGWAQKIDENHTKYSAIYKFKAGKTYTLTVSGRSQRFNIDRIVFFNTKTSSLAEAQNTSRGETKGGTCPDPMDCAKVEGGSAYIDDCGECVGGTTGLEPCVLEPDCAGVPGGTAFIDNCGECVGGTTGLEPCTEDCAGVVGGTAYIDNCGECVGGTTGKEPCATDCAGVPGGSAYTDDCGECVGGTTGKVPCVEDCAGVLGGSAYIDDCGTCVGGTTGVEPCVQDCAGVPGGTATIICGECVGGTTGKTAPDADGDGIVDCEDICPNDPNNNCGPSFPGRIQAEDFVNQAGVVVAPTSDIDGVEHIRKLDNGDFTEYEIAVSETGTYQFDVRYTNGIAVTSDMDISMNGINVGNIKLPQTGAWGDWVTKSNDINLQAGIQTLRLDFNNKSTFQYCYDINWFEAIKKDDPCLVNTAPTVSVTSPVDGASFTVGTSISLAANATDVDGSIASIVYLVDGVEITGSSYVMTSGSHTIAAIATDDCGVSTTSSEIVINEQSSSVFDTDIYIVHKSSGNKLFNNGTAETVTTAAPTKMGDKVTWKLVSIADDPGYYRLEHKASARWFHCEEDGITRLILGPTTWTKERTKWKVVEIDGDDHVHLEHKASGLRLHVKPDGVTDFQLGPQTWTKDNTRWKLVPLAKSSKDESISNNKESFIEVYPNPANSHINIVLDDISENAQLNIVSVTGELLLSKKLDSSINEVNINMLESGLYIFRIQNGNTIKLETISVY